MAAPPVMQALPADMVEAPDVGAKYAQLSETQAFCEHKFHYYRNGIAGYSLEYQDIQDGFLIGDPELTNRWQDIQRRGVIPPPQVLPPLAQFQFNVNHRNRLRALAVARRTPLRNLANPARPMIDRETRELVRQEYTSAYAQMRACFRYIKCLSWGGQGITSLWRYSPGPGQSHAVVMKMSINPKSIPVAYARRLVISTRDIDKERHILSQLGRAPHIVQRFYTAHHPRNVDPNRGSRRSRRQAQSVEMMSNMVDSWHGHSHFLMEYCKFGNLEAQLRRAAQDGPNGVERYFPEPVLWRFFDCLVKGCMAMEEPPMQNTATATLPSNFQGDFLPEQISGVNNQYREGIAHMDLSSSMALIHRLFPCHSFLDAQTFHAYRQAILSGPLRYNVEREEQFGKDWGRIARFDDPSDTNNSHINWPPPWMQPWGPPPPITSGPARYTAASNLWHVGMIIKTAMTLVNPDLPPYAGRMTTAEPANPIPSQERWTYGFSLIDPREPWATNNMYSQALRDLVAACLMSKQEHRPTLNNIQQTINQQLAMPANQQIPQYYATTFFREPPPPTPPDITADLGTVDPFYDYEAAQALA
ncbi:hypothetical protein DHEL01_v204820 [Diaporthe helianthi]|uniref:Protein kinase domain-containing protein n=1 Tax=Diaporthe helianthi TaxID=158607 RepID=A0A2P5I2T6_DIAHE|nr:hypothetical protein DHEL01_v204820 [Diaporthe helianthi]